MVEPATFNEALRGLVNRDFLASRKWQEQQWRANRTGADAGIVLFERKLIKAAERLGVPLFAHCVVRTPEEQLLLFQGGQSKDSPADGRWPHRKHAVDVVHSVRAWNLTNKEWAVIGHLGKEVAKASGVKVDWGGDWKSFYDPAHWEISGWKNMR